MGGIWNDFEQFIAANDRWIWIVLGTAIAVIVLAILVGLVMARKRERNRRRDAELRQRQHDRAEQAARLDKTEQQEHGSSYASTHRH